VKRTARRSAGAVAGSSHEPYTAAELPTEEEPQSPDAHGLRISDILEAFPFYVLLVDDRHRILQANGVVRDQLGLTPEEVVGEYCPKVVHGCDEPWYACPLEEAAEKGEPVEREVFDRDTGRWVRAAIYPTAALTPDGARIYFHAVSDITAAKQVEDELRASREQLRELSRFLESVREDERTRLARDLHDELGQTLTALKIDVAWLAKRLPQEQGALLEKTGSMYELIDGAIHTVRRISAELRPGVLDDLGLADAIEWQVQELGKLTETEFRFSARPEHMVLDPDRSTAIFRICQEALTNVVRHAGATRVTVSLRKAADRVSLTIKDNGKGVEDSQILDPGAFGLLGMRERARIWGGTVRIEGAPGKGTVVAVSIPLATKGGPGC
jgi:PAS domain S-box-containing protein